MAHYGRSEGWRHTIIGMIWAQGHGRAIGRDGTMPWHIPEDLRFFQRVTMGHPVIMGRRTWGSLGERYRPLPGRANIVVSRNLQFEAPGATVVRSLDEAINLGILEGILSLEAKGSEQAGDTERITVPSSGPVVPGTSRETTHVDPLLWIMGGAQIYAQALPLADFAVVTHVDLDVPGADAFAPEIPEEWSAASIDTRVASNDASNPGSPHGWNTSVKGPRYRFTVYARPGFTPPTSLFG